MATRRDDEPTDWDWWASLEFPPGPLRDFVPDDWPAARRPEKWRQFCDARIAAAPMGWRLATCRAMTGTVSRRFKKAIHDHYGTTT